MLQVSHTKTVRHFSICWKRLFCDLNMERIINQFLSELPLFVF